ncbi:hypothetical protein AWU65_00095 [Paenibacillus glucanolyticus]|uniref:Lipoprotein n=1 Tax=Paenibacillus glucanolyticus TaxID=59843 RepID=A0A163D8M2_9BACL|nr:hypothetical protein AWU65_00095 [Paenibacillus glucanolyticus]
MMKNAMVLFCICLMLMVCKSNADSVDTPPYEGPPFEGRSLVIGLIGETPNIREENIDFEEVTFKQLEEGLSSDLDAIFITKEFLVEASNPQYAKVYHHSDIPFFYIESKKSHVPFTIEELSYADVPDLSAYAYATGYYGEESHYWEYGLYNDVRNESNIQDVYSRIFTTIESLQL